LDFLRNQLERYDLVQHCQVIRQTSQEAASLWSRNIDLLFVDGDHSLAGVRRDFESFAPSINPDGLIVFHDSSWEHEKAWTSNREESWYRADMGVPAYLSHLQEEGYQSVTLGPTPGLTIMHPRVGGFDFLAGRAASAAGSPATS
jgi:predicted O-methyltransferase YrrM